MIERAYTVTEIDDLREVVRTRYQFGTSYMPLSHGSRTSRIFREEEMAVGVEQQIRTYMLAGLTSEDIIEADTEKYESLPTGLVGFPVKITES
jgi:hypothetical protein